MLRADGLLRSLLPRAQGRLRRGAAPLGLALLACVGLGFGPCERDVRPIVFVHGGFGSGAQFESQAMRFASNGYPAERVTVVEYDSFGLAFPEDLPVVFEALDAKIAALQERTGHAQVDLIGHSRGTTVSHAYLASPERAADVAHYVNIDGRSADAPPGGVPTLALWAGAVERDEPREIAGARNVTVPRQEHVEVATSEESFDEMYRFLRGHRPFTTKILPELRPRVSGRAVSFPENTGLSDATVEVWWVRGETGERIGSRPRARLEVAPDGSFGPYRAWYGAHYEFAVVREGEPTYHYFLEPFLRDDRLVRLNVAPLLEGFLDTSEDHSVVSVLRYKEFWGDRGAENDVLRIDGTNVITPGNAPSGEVGEASVAFFATDVGADGTSDLGTIPPPLGALPFLTGADLYVPSDPPRTIAIETVPRGDGSEARRLNVRNVPSSDGRVVVQLRDFEQ